MGRPPWVNNLRSSGSSRFVSPDRTHHAEWASGTRTLRQEVLEERLKASGGKARSQLGRDAYTLWHFPLVSGIIALAVGFEAAFHPGDYSTGQVAAAVGVGLALFLLSTAGALWRAERCVLWNRLIVLGLTVGAVTVASSSSPIALLSVACGGLAVIVVIEQVTVRRKLAAR